MTFCADPSLAADRSRIASKPAPKPSKRVLAKPDSWKPVDGQAALFELSSWAKTLRTGVLWVVYSW